MSPEGHRVGIICVLDIKPRTLSDAQIFGLQALARQAIAQLELKTQIEDAAEETISEVKDGVMSEMDETKTVMNDGLSVTSELEPLVQEVVIAGNVLVKASDLVEEMMA